MSLPWFDANCILGPRTAGPAETRLSLAETTDLLSQVGISRALITGCVACDYDPCEGNDRLARELAGHDGLLPCFVVLPPQTGEFPGGDALVRYLHDGGARAVRLYPRQHNYGLGRRWTDPLFAPLAEAGVPVLLDAAESSWPEVDEILSAHPALELVICRPTYRQFRWVAPLLDTHPTLYLETSLWQAHGGIEAIVERFGPQRLLFGSGLPEFAPGGAMALITYARISDDAKAAIGGGTLADLLWTGDER